MATQGMITGEVNNWLKSICLYIFRNSGVSAIYKRLLNHRPVIQNEVQFFVKEFEVGYSLCVFSRYMVSLL